MYCPLCKAEYRTGTEQCSDCLIKLLQKREEAESVKVAVLWEGNLSRLNAISGVLLDAQIPNHITGLNPLGIKQLHKALPPWWAFTGIGSMIYTFRRERKKSESWRISVLESDYPAAKTALDNLLYGYDKTVTPTGLLEVTNSAASTEPQAKSAKWLYLELCVMLLVFIFSAIINVFLAVSDSVFPLDNKPTAPNTIVVVGMLIGMVALWRAILRREPKTNDKFRKKHLRFVSVAGAALAVLLSTAALWGYKNGDDRIKVHKIEVLLSDFTAVGQVATRVDEIRSRSMKTTKDYVDAYSEVEAPLGEWKSKVDQVSLELEEIRRLNLLTGTVPIVPAFSQGLDLAKQRIALIEKMVAVTKEMGALPSDSQVAYWNRNFKPLLAQDDELMTEATKMQQKLKDLAGNKNE